MTRRLGSLLHPKDREREKPEAELRDRARAREEKGLGKRIQHNSTTERRGRLEQKTQALDHSSEERQRFGPRQKTYAERQVLWVVYLSTVCPGPWLSHSRAVQAGDRAPLPISHTIQNKVCGVPPARKGRTDTGKSIGKREGEREGGKNKVPGHRPPHPHLLSISAGGTT